jgi:hypothetical protein
LAVVVFEVVVVTKRVIAARKIRECAKAVKPL